MSLRVENHRKSYKDIHALKSLSFSLEQGTCTALLGPNGAGKSTAIRILVSLQKPDSGSYSWNGEDLFAKPSRIRDLVGYVSQEIALDKHLTGAEFMRFTAGLLHLDWKQHRDRAYALLETVGLKDAQDRQIGEYSGGMKRRLDLASALLHDPKVLVLDEPTTGLDIEAKEQIWELIRNYMAKDGALILASHDFREVQELASQVLILQKGEIAVQGAPEDLKGHLGSSVIRIKTHEFMNAEQKEAVKKALTSHAASFEWRHEDDSATITWREQEPINLLQTRIYETLERSGLPIYSINVQKPTLEDVYRFSLERDQ